MKRFWLLGLLLLVGGVALADSGMLPGGETLTWTMRTFLHEDNSETPKLPKQDPQSFWNYFNMAHCECSQFTANDPSPTNAVTGAPFFEGTFNQELQFTGGMPSTSQPVDIWTGTSCDQDLLRPNLCVQVSSIADITSIATTGGLTQIPVKLYDLMQPTRDMTTGVRAGCQPVEGNPQLWVLARTMGTSMYDYSLTKSFAIDTWAPCAPTAYDVTGAESAIEIKWTPSTSKISDIAYYQALCATDGNQPAFTKPPFAARYLTSYQLCGRSDPADPIHPVVLDDSGHGTANIACEGMGSITTDGGVPTTDAATGSAALQLAGSDAAVDAAPDAPADADMGSGAVDDTVFGTLDPMFVCGESPSATATSMRIEGLQNDVPYKVALLTIDKYGNPRVAFFEKEITPHAVTDFWEDLHDQGSHVQGGFCLIAETYGDDNPLTNVLRSFRDNTLGGSRAGRWLTEAYYATLGKLGAYVHGHLALRIVSGVLLLPLVALALLWHFVTLPILLLLVVAAVWNRRRVLKIRSRVRLAQVSAAAVVLLVATHAHAQSPYWEDQTTGTNPDEASLAVEPDQTAWHVGIRLGPYTPAIDDQIGVKNSAGQGPYAAMFGTSSSWMPMIDVDHYLWKRVGQLGVGLSVGYMGRSAHAYQENTNPADPNRPRSSGDTNSFRLIPLVVSAVYRFSYLDDEYGIPVVPYARAGIGYYIWWITAPDGNFAAVCTNGGMPPCTENKAAGASLGFVGSIGLSLRAERIDASAARSMHESGIDHAGFYGEVSYGKVDGFGSQTKLSVGDTTWFAGVEFEF